MAYVRKTYDEFDIQQFTSEGWETVSCEPTSKLARQIRLDYQKNQPEYPVRIRKRRVKIQAPGARGIL